ncbi:M48 family metallopeptidase [Leptothoe sp. PORK10 BA2]|uniref:M48 family metallopeptidase n=1 Tax=Leptothoe sp. PORK10 BA2 TaxID=3110254 RepID=UPI002B1F28D9|nr:M48 family metallopeptidase [Leptothoe sp. PORK10 BA2]MEA5463970.1 M48 family metallopeptidase [Leptothoe sp. PORK10 BA2]
MDKKSILTGLRANHFRHPLDLQATESLKQLPGLGLAIRTLLRPTAEQFFYLENIATSVLVGPHQLPAIYGLLEEACQVLDIEPPQLYVKQHPVPNAYTFAMRGKQPFIVVHTSLIEFLNPQELQAVLGHELGHLKCDHGVYLTLANLIALAASHLPLGPVLAQNLQSQILEWVRCAEFTCDRAALLVSQDARVVASVLMKLAGGSPTLSPQLNLDAFLSQANAYEDLSHDQLGAFLKQIRAQELTHPVPVLRAKEITQWHGTLDYQKLLETCSIQYNNDSTKGGWRNW